MNEQEVISHTMSTWGKKGRQNLKDKLGEEGFRKYMGNLGAKGKGKSKNRKAKVSNMAKNKDKKVVSSDLLTV